MRVITVLLDYTFFLCRFLRSLFFLLWVAILARLRFRPQGNRITSFEGRRLD
ncbi:MAG TPA: hypothetical protein VF398_10015 [bacterium]